jgi:iron complex transport system substrate-binding protein
MTRSLLPTLFLLSLASFSHAEERCARIVSLAPSITEVLFELGLGDRVVGVTRYCRYPAAAQKIENIGGFYDVSLEKILSMRPSYLFGLRENNDVRSAVSRFGVPSRELDHSSLKGIKMSVQAIADSCDVSERAEEVLRALAERERVIASRKRPVRPLRTLVVVGRVFEGETLSGLYVSGKDGFYSDLLKLVGLENINNETTISIPMLSPEGLISLAPEVIIEVVNRDDPNKEEEISSLWSRYPNLPATRNKRVIILKDDFASIPGPRYILIAEQLARRLSEQGDPHE